MESYGVNTGMGGRARGVFREKFFEISFMQTFCQCQIFLAFQLF